VLGTGWAVDVGWAVCCCGFLPAVDLGIWIFSQVWGTENLTPPRRAGI